MRFSDLDGARVGLWGLGRETRSLVRHLRARLPRATVVAVAGDDAAPAAAALAELGIVDAAAVTGAAIGPALAGCDVVVRSPGVSIHTPVARAVRDAGVPLTTATALWLAEDPGRLTVGVTGTKGKSTTAALIAHLAAACGGRAVQLAGNIGRPALDLLDEPPADVAVIELSSYQLADLEVGPRVAVFTNVYPEHLDWHGSHAVYRADKLRLMGLPNVAAAVVNGRDPTLVAAAEEVGAAAATPPAGASAGPAPAAGPAPSAGPGAAGPAPRATPIVTRYGIPGGYDVAPAGVVRDDRLVLARDDLPLPGDHNALNLCAALAALAAAGLPEPELPAALAGFRPLPHRLEPVVDRGGVRWVNDSISTTPESALAALASFPDDDVVLLAGGTDRGQDYAALGRELARRRLVVVGVPETGDRLVAAARAAGVPLEDAVVAPDLPAAVATAARRVRPGGVVLLSPAGPSYHAYASFEARGDHFRALADAHAHAAPDPA